VEWARETFEASRVKEATMSNATNLHSYRQRKRDRAYKRLDVWIPAHCRRNLHELKTDFDPDLATVLIRLAPAWRAPATRLKGKCVKKSSSIAHAGLSTMRKIKVLETQYSDY
jgi:hypothetical protein